MVNIKLSMDALRLRRIKKQLKKVKKHQDHMKALSDFELQAKTLEFKERLRLGESLDQLLPEAFATMCEANYRVLGMYPYDVQIMGGIILHQGDIAEMKTGEGKTLTATLPVYLNALTGEGVMVITVNDYLSARDKEEMAPVYEWMGLSCALGFSENLEEKLDASDKQIIYKSDIIYTTHSALGFDYLFDNLAESKKEQYMRTLNYIILDEIDSVLLDSATTPLLISGSPRVQSNLYGMCQQFIEMLDSKVHYDYTEEQDAVWFTPAGIDEAEHYFRVENIYHGDNEELIRHLTLALKAQVLFQNEHDYVVLNNEVMLLDKRNGRILEGTKLQSGIHQAIEAKSYVELSEDNRAMATITYQNLFKMFKKISGMSGTAKVAESEFQETYGVSVIQVPTHRPVQRIDYPDTVFRSFPEKVNASLKYIRQLHKTGQPLLIATGSVELSQLYSNLLLKEGIAHNVLNAYNAAKEAEMIKEAGQLNAVTVATAMAGRGTDIKLGEGVEEIGGLAVIGTERMMSKRIDLQLRGRAGRQGDPGLSKFFSSLEDELILKWAPEKYRYHQEDDDPKRKVKALPRRYESIFEQAQDASDASGEQARKQSLEFDENMRIQRNIVYQTRRKLLNNDNFEDLSIPKMAETVFKQFVNSHSTLKASLLERYIWDNLSYNFKGMDTDLNYNHPEEVVDYLLALFESNLQVKQEKMSEGVFQDFIRKCILKAIDENWIVEVDYLNQFKTIVTSRNSAQRNPIYEYQKESSWAYQHLKAKIYQDSIRYMALSDIRVGKDSQPIVHFA